MWSISIFSSGSQSSISTQMEAPKQTQASFWSRFWPFGSTSTATPLQEKIIEQAPETETSAKSASLWQRLKPSFSLPSISLPALPSVSLPSLPRWPGATAPPSIDQMSNPELLNTMGTKIQNSLTASTKDGNNVIKADTDEVLNEFIKKASMFGTLTMMDTNLSSADSADIIKKVCDEKRSLLDVYMENHGDKLGFFGSLSIKFTYFIYYHCGIIPNTVDAIAKSLLEKMRSELVLKDGGKNLNNLMSKTLSHASSFLANYLRAVKEFNEGKGKNDLDAYLSEQLQQPIDRICEEFGDTAINHLFPEKIPFFQSWKEDSKHRSIRILSTIFTYPLEAYLNYRVKKELREQIPSLTKSLVESSTQETHQKNLPFSVSITMAIKDQLILFKDQLSESNFIADETPIEMSGTEKLPQVVSKLLEILELEKPDSGILSPFKNIMSSMVTSSLQTSIVDGCRAFFEYCSEPANSETFFYQLLSLANIPFTGQAPSTPEEWNRLENIYSEQKSLMRSEAGDLFKTLIHQSVSSQIQGLSEEDMQQIANQYSQSHRDGLRDTADLLDADLLKMKETLQIPSRSILHQLDSFLSSVNSYRAPAAIEENPLLSGAFKEGIAQTLKPSYLHLNTLVDEAITAKEIQKTFTTDSAIAKELETIHNLLQQCSLKTAAAVLPKISPVYQSALNQIHSQREDTDLIAALLQEHFEQLEQFNKEFQANDLTVKNLKSLNDLLSQLAHATDQRITGEKSDFQWTKNRKQIEILSQVLPDEEKEVLHAFIDALEQSQSLQDSNSHKIVLHRKLKDLHFDYCRKRENSELRFTNSLQTAQSRAWESFESIDSSARVAHEDLQGSLNIMTNALVELRKTIPEILPKRNETRDAQIVRSLGGTVSLITGAATAALGVGLTHYMGTTYATPILGGAMGALYSWKKNPAINKLSLLNRTALGVLSGFGATYASYPTIANTYIAPTILSGTATYIAPAILASTAIGQETQKAASATISDSIVYPQVMEIFDNMYEFIVKEGHVKKWAVIDSVNMINEAYRKP